MNIEALQRHLRSFAVARDWQSYHAPKNLAMALMVEAAELMEHFQWSTLTESRGLARDPVKKEAVADELADVLLYLLQLADQTDIDVEFAVTNKLRKNAIKHPPKYQELEPVLEEFKRQDQHVHLLVDWENVQPDGDALKELAPDCTNLWLLHGPQQKVTLDGYHQVFGSDRVVAVPRSGKGKNALDFQLCYYMGYLTATKANGRFVVVSNDQGYEPMLEHARTLGFSAERRGYVKPPKPAVAKAEKAEVVQRLVKMLRRLEEHQARFRSHRALEIAEAAWSNLKMMPLSARPSRPQAIADYLRLFIKPDDACADELVQQIRNALVGRGALTLAVNMDAAVAIKPTSTARTELRISSGTVPSVVADKTADRLLKSKGLEKKAPGSESTVTQMLESKSVQQAPEDLTKHVLASLKKMSSNRPNSRVALLRTITTLAGKRSDSQAIAHRVLALLEKRKDVQVLPDGKHIRYPRLDSGQKVAVKVPAGKPVKKPAVKAINKRAASAR